MRPDSVTRPAAEGEEPSVAAGGDELGYGEPALAAVYGEEGLELRELVAVCRYIRRDYGVVAGRGDALGALYGGVYILLLHGVPLLGEAAARQQQRAYEREGYNASLHRTASK